jgi:hypothetical protein
MRKLLFLCLLALWCVGGQAGIFKPGTTRTKTLASGSYFVYNACWYNGSTDWTGFFYSADGAMKVSHGTSSKPSTLSTYDPSMFWTIEVVNSTTGQCTMRNADGLYVDYTGALTTKKSYVWITAYEHGQDYVCGDDVYVENADDETKSTLPTGTVEGVWIIGNEGKTQYWASDYGTGFKTQSAGQPMVLLPAKTTQCNITSVESLSAPTTLTIGSYVMLYNNATGKYVTEGPSLSDVTIDNVGSTAQLKLCETGCEKGNFVYNTHIFKVGGTAGAYTFQNVTTGSYVQALNESNACYDGSTAETFSIVDNSDGTITLKGSNGQCFDQITSGGNSFVVGWSGGGDNSKYKVSVVSMTTEEVNVVEVLYNTVCGEDVYCSSIDLVSPSNDYTYTAPKTIFGYATEDTAPETGVVSASKTVEYTYTKDESVTLPFSTSTLASDGKFAEDTKWYRIQVMEAGRYAKYESDTSIPANSFTTKEFPDLFMISGDVFSGFKIQNLAAGADKFLTINDENGSCKFTKTGTTFDYILTKTTDGNDLNLFKARGTDNAYLCNYNVSLGTWRDDQASTVKNSDIVFIAVEKPMGTVTFEGGQYSADDKLVYNNTEYANGDEMPWYACYNTSGVTVKDGKLAILNPNMMKSSIVATFPFKTSTVSDGYFDDSNLHWYNLNIRGTKYCVYDIYDEINHNVVKSTPTGLTYGSMYCFAKVDGVDNGYKMYNRMTGAAVSFTNSGADKELGKYTSNGTTLILKTNGNNGFVFQIKDVENAYVNDVNNQLGVWNADKASTDTGSTFLFEEVTEADETAAQDMPQPGKFYTIRETTTSQYLTPEVASGNSDRLAMQKNLTSPTAADEAARIFYFTGTHLLGYTNGRFVGISSDYMLNQAAVGSVGTSLYFNKVSGTSAEVYNVVYYYLTDVDYQKVQNDRYLHGAYDGYADGSSAPGDDATGYKFYVEEVTKLPLTIGSNGWSTFSAPVKVALLNETDQEATVYYAPSSPEDGKLMLEALEDNMIPANTGVIIKGTEGETVYLTTAVPEDEVTIKSNTLVPNVVATSIKGESSDGNYAFATNTNTHVSGFMKLLTSITLDGHKCWLQLSNAAVSTDPSAASAQFIPISLADDPTGIEAAETATVSDSNAPVYDLQGRKVNGTKKGGMYIQNGKVFIAM